MISEDYFPTNLAITTGSHKKYFVKKPYRAIPRVNFHGKIVTCYFL